MEPQHEKKEPHYGKRIREMRKTFRLTQAEFAEKVGISMMSLRRYESDERQPTIQTIERMASTLGLTLGEFLWNSPEIKRGPLWVADLKDKLKQVGCSLTWDEDNVCIWINYSNGTLEVSEKDLLMLHDTTNSFMKFQLEEIKKKYPKNFHRKNDSTEADK